MGSNLKLTSDSGIERLVYDMECLLHESKSADTVFFIGIKETPIPCHSFLLKQRCRNYRGDTQRYPGISAELFQTFLNYVYTGKLIIEESNLLDLLCLANEFGMDDLENTCEELIYTNLESSPIKACTLLTNALSIKKKKCGFNNLLNGQNNNGHSINSSSSSFSSAVRGFHHLNSNSNSNNNGHPNTGLYKKNLLNNSNNSSGTGIASNVALGGGSGSSSALSSIGKCLHNIIDHCTKLIGENPAELIQNPKFLSIPMDTLIAIISSDQLCLEEEQIWRYVLKWAQFNANVETPLLKWTEEDRAKVAKYLTPVISHVRLLLIDSRVFAEEVEPTGCVPMELSLERYRYAALSQQQFIQNNIGIPAPKQLPSSSSSSLSAPESTTNTLSRIIPRNPPKLFQSSVIIQKSSLAKRLNEWYFETMTSNDDSMNGSATINNTLNGSLGKSVSTAAISKSQPGITMPSSWKCIYRASVHGFSAEAFHKYCDGHSPTFTISQLGHTKHICGGFTDIPWKSCKISKYVTSNKSFLFSYNGETSTNSSSAAIATEEDLEPIRFKIVKKHFGVCHYEESGPIFGAGADLFISSNCDINNESYSNLHSYEFDNSSINSGKNGSGHGSFHHHQQQQQQQQKCAGISGGLLTPTYNFVISDYEVFIPIEVENDQTTNTASAGPTVPVLPLPRSQSTSCVQNNNNANNGNINTSNNNNNAKASSS